MCVFVFVRVCVCPNLQCAKSQNLPCGLLLTACLCFLFARTHSADGWEFSHFNQYLTPSDKETLAKYKLVLFSVFVKLSLLTLKYVPILTTSIYACQSVWPYSDLNSWHGAWKCM